MLINGGSNKARNYQSHLLHVRELVGVLLGAGLDKRDIAVFASDGPDPAPDLAVRDLQPERRFWLIEGLSAGARLSTKVRYVSSELPELPLRPAKKSTLRLWFETEGASMRAGDTLLLYVTDHGKKNKSNLSNNAIVLWGEDLLVTELAAMLATLPRGVRVVALMSQCFSGAFANLMHERNRVTAPSGNVCGYFSSTANRQAYGCYPENRGKENVGHSFHFIEALRLLGSFTDAHARVLLSDRTPDVPLRTSDYYLEELLDREATRRGIGVDDLIDGLLEQAWLDELHYRTEFAGIDKIGEAFGSFGPRSLRELSERAGNLPGLAHDLRSHTRRWRTALSELRRENFYRFLEENVFWKEYLRPDFIELLEVEDKRDLSAWLLEDLAAFTASDPSVRHRLRALRTIALEAQAAGYRMEVRLGVVLRMRTLLTRIAGKVYLDRYGSNREREAFEALSECESFRLGKPRRRSARELDLPPPFPPLIDEMHLLAGVLPGWIGIEYGAVNRGTRHYLGLAAGAVAVTRVYPHSPAAEAGIEAGDIILGPPEAYFVERHRIREWTMTSLADQIRALDVLRNGRIRTLRVRVGAAPAE